jgi:hypothetical protein
MNNLYTYQTYQYNAAERQEKARQQQRAQEIKPQSDDLKQNKRNKQS